MELDETFFSETFEYAVIRDINALEEIELLWED